MRTTWILISDSSRARIFEKKEHEKHLEEVEDFVDSMGRATNNELRTDGRGRFYGKANETRAMPRSQPFRRLSMRTTCSPISLPDTSMTPARRTDITVCTLLPRPNF
jgi:hypothetical protein